MRNVRAPKRSGMILNDVVTVAKLHMHKDHGARFRYQSCPPESKRGCDDWHNGSLKFREPAQLLVACLAARHIRRCRLWAAKNDSWWPWLTGRSGPGKSRKSSERRSDEGVMNPGRDILDKKRGDYSWGCSYCSRCSGAAAMRGHPERSRSKGGGFSWDLRPRNAESGGG